MPTYDYACSGCKHRFERFEPIGDGGLKPCPKCGRKKAKRMLGTGAGLIFKGSGFYATDSKPSPKGGDNGGGSKDGGSKDSGSKDSEKKTPGKEKEKEKKEEKEPKK